MGNLVKALKIAANVAEIIVAGSVLIELAEKYGAVTFCSSRYTAFGY